MQLRNALSAIAPIKDICENSVQDTLRSFGEQLNPCSLIRDRIAREIVDDAPAAVNRGQSYARGSTPNSTNCAKSRIKARDYLLRIQQREIAATGIPSLKIAFNNVFGYYIEVTNTHRDKSAAGMDKKADTGQCRTLHHSRTEGI